MRVGQDAALAAQIRDELRDVPMLVGRFVLVSVAEGIAVISGVCPSEVARQTALVVAGHVAGVVEVRDEVVVEQPQGIPGFQHPHSQE